MDKFKRSSVLLIPLILLLIVNCNDTVEHSNPEEEEALNAAKGWLNLIDEGDYNQSWQRTSTSIKNKITRRQWEIALKQIRLPLGKIENRKVFLVRSINADSQNSSQKDKVIGFSTLFENENTVKEYVTIQFDDSHEWQVSAYYIDR